MEILTLVKLITSCQNPEVAENQKKTSNCFACYAIGGNTILKWFRFYDEILDDPKLFNLSDSEFRCFVNMLCLANKRSRDTQGQVKRGSIDVQGVNLLRLLRCHHKTFESTTRKLTELSIISNNGNGIEFIHWDKRQYESDDVNIRVKRYRNVTRNVTVTPPDNRVQNTDTDKEKKKKELPKFELPDWMPDSEWSVFLSHRKSMKAPVTKESYPLFIEKFFRLKSKGYAPEFVIGTMVERGWRWFKPEWVKDSNPMFAKFGEKGARTVASMQKWLEETKDEE